MSELEREKLMYLQPYMIGGQAGRACTSFAPVRNRNSVILRSCVPRTIESSMRIMRWFSISSCTGISFIRAIMSRLDCTVGMKLRGHVGVYLISGREKGMPDSLA